MNVHTVHLKTLVFCMAMAIVVSSGVLMLCGAAAPSNTGRAVKWEYRQLPTTAHFSEWNRLGQEGWEYAGTFERAVIFKRRIAAQ